MDIYKEFADRIRNLRVSKGLKSKEVAEMVGISPSVYGRFENHGIKMPLDRIVQILDVLGFQLDISKKKLQSTC